MLWHRLDQELPPLRKQVLIWRGMSDSDGGFPMMGKHVMFYDKSYIRFKGADTGWDVLDESEYKDTRWAEVERPEKTNISLDVANLTEREKKAAANAVIKLRRSDLRNEKSILIQQKADLAIKLHESGMTLKEIAESTGINIGSVRYFVSSYGRRDMKRREKRIAAYLEDKMNENKA